MRNTKDRGQRSKVKERGQRKNSERFRCRTESLRCEFWTPSKDVKLTIKKNKKVKRERERSEAREGQDITTMGMGQMITATLNMS